MMCKHKICCIKVRRHTVSTLRMKVSDLLFIRTLIRYLDTLEQISIAYIQTTNLTITMLFTLDVTRPASQTDRLFKAYLH